MIYGGTNSYRAGVTRARKLACKLRKKVTLGMNDGEGKRYIIYAGTHPPHVRPGVGFTPSVVFCAKKRHRIP